jgi:type III pantothenate kinase
VSHKITLGVGIDYPKPETIGADRLANAAAAVALYGSPAIVVDFGTAVTFDVISAAGDYAGGVIAPGLNAMTDYLHNRTALLPRVSLREPHRAIGRSTVEAMRSGAIHGYGADCRNPANNEGDSFKSRTHHRNRWRCKTHRGSTGLFFAVSPAPHS